MGAKSNQRLISLDLLKILCMIMIVTLHFVSHGGLGEYFSKSPAMHYVMQLLRALSICSVNVFVLISGYFLIGKQGLNIKRFLSIALSVWFYAWCYFAITATTGMADFGIKEILASLLPISYKLYWFPTCYLCLYILSPFLNKFLIALSKRSYLTLLVVLFLLFSVWNEVAVMSDPFRLVDGYSFLWFVFLYCLSGFIRLHGDDFFKGFKANRWLWIYLGSAVLIAAIDSVLAFLGGYMSFIGEYGLVHHFSRYCSILVVVESLSLFMFFKSIDIKRLSVQKALTFISPLTFGVYLLHDNANIRRVLYFDILRLDTLPDNLLALPIILAYILLLFSICCMIEYLRKTGFSFLERSAPYTKLCNKAQNRINTLFE